jgi:hypothetical protein
MTYSVKYKTEKQIFWRTLKKVKGDLIPQDLPGFRVFILEDETRIEIPLSGTQFYFCNRRFLTIKAQAEKELGQRLPLN